MKLPISILIILLLASCGPSTTKQEIKTGSDTFSTNTTTNDQNPIVQVLDGFKKATLFRLSDTISADFNGDGFPDKAFYKRERGTSGIIIQHGSTNEVVRIGFGKQFADMTEFNWVDYWGLLEDKETSETIFTEDGDVQESKVVSLENPSIVLGKNEVGGGLITFRKGKYEWIQQAC